MSRKAFVFELVITVDNPLSGKISDVGLPSSFLTLDHNQKMSACPIQICKTGYAMPCSYIMHDVSIGNLRVHLFQFYYRNVNVL